MRKSELLLPLRIYDNLFDQHRFHTPCEPLHECAPPLYVPTHLLPQFQFTRTSSLEVPLRLTMRNICVDDQFGYYKVIPPSAAIFNPQSSYWGAFPKREDGVFDNGSGPQDAQFTIFALAPCGGVKNGDWSMVNTPGDFTPTGGTRAVLEATGVSSGAGWYHVKLVVETFVQSSGSSFKLLLVNGDYNGSYVVVQEITAAGIYEFDFDPTLTALQLVAQDWDADDEFLVTEFQCSLLNPALYSGHIDDRALDTTKIKIIKLADEVDKDVIVYCGDTADYAPVPGVYYYIIEMGEELYFSETFTVKKQKDLDKFYRLYWKNACDIGRIIFNSTTLSGCNYYSAFYFDGTLFNPKYETTEDTEPNGAGEEIATFKRWEKSQEFLIPKSTPWLTDALSALFLFDTVTLQPAINSLQVVRQDSEEIEKVLSEVSDGEDSCYQKVVLTMISTEAVNQTNCCLANNVFACDTDTPVIDSNIESPSGTWVFYGTGLPGAFAVLQYNLNGAGWVDYDYVLIAADGTWGPVQIVSGDFVGITDLDIRIHAKTITCDVGTSAAIDII